MTTSQPVESDLAIHPGEILAEELEARGMTQRALAALLGRTPQSVSEIVHGKRTITPATAIALERALGTPARVWLNLQVDYDLASARARSRPA